MSPVAEANQKPIASAGDDIEQPLKYPSYPFPVEWCTKLSELPAGFRDLALSRELSEEMTDVILDLARVMHLVEKGATRRRAL